MEMSMYKCPACRDKLKSAVLHLHNQQSLLQKIKTSFEDVRGQLIAKIEKLYDIIQHKLPHTDDKHKDKEMYINNARFWIQTLSPECVYYGRFITPENDAEVHELVTFKPSKKRKIENSHENKNVYYTQPQATTFTNTFSDQINLGDIFENC